MVPNCNDLASTFNFTINFCATNATLATVTLHEIRLTDAMTVGVFLGGQNFTSCEALHTNGSVSATASPTASATAGSSTSAMPSASAGAAAGRADVTSLWSLLGFGCLAVALGL
jgi:hypothetical protein